MALLRLPLRIAFLLLVELPGIGAAYGHRWLERGTPGREFRPMSPWAYRAVGVVSLLAVVSCLGLLATLVRGV